MPQFGLLSIPVFLVMYMLSGANTPLDAMPELLQRLMLVSPTTHFVAAGPVAPEKTPISRRIKKNSQ